MPEKNNIVCSICQKQFGTVYNLNKHARKYHSDQINLIIPQKTYLCDHCPKNFSHLKSLNRHKKIHNQNQDSNNLSSALKLNNTCPICKLKAPKSQLVTHFEVEHDVKCPIETYEFTSFEEFSNWKTAVEYNTKSRYVVERGSQSTKAKTRQIQYCCHRSGMYNTRGKGLRHLKSQGSNKIGGFCPAGLKLFIDENKQCKVFYTNQHVGHDVNDLCHLYPTSNKRKLSANRRALKNKRQIKEDTDISEEACEIVRFEITEVVDIEEHLAAEKRKLLEDFSQIVQSVKNMEQLDAAKEMCIGLKITVDALATKQQLGESCALEICSESNKKLHLNETNYVLLRKN